MAITQDEIDALAREPQKVEGEEGSITNRPLADVQAAADIAATQAAVTRAGGAWAALGKARLVPPGAIGPRET